MRPPSERPATISSHPPGEGAASESTTKARLTLLLGVLGWVLSYAMFVRFLQAHGWDFLGGWVEAFTGSDFGVGLLLDLVATTGMMIVLAIGDRRRLGARGAVLVIACLALSVSMSLAVYLLMIWRHERLTRVAPPS